MDPDMVITVGRLLVTPNAVNVVPGKVELTLELRAVKEESILKAHAMLMEEFGDVIASSEMIQQERAYPMDPQVMAAIHRSSDDLGLTSREMVSGAGHDTMSLAQITRPGMIFVPSVGGISHSDKEWTQWSDVANGANVLLGALLHLDQQSQ